MSQRGNCEGCINYDHENSNADICDGCSRNPNLIDYYEDEREELIDEDDMRAGRRAE